MSTTSRRGGPGGAVLILAATIIAGVAGYLVTLLVYRFIGPASYATFAVFWAALYLVIGAVSGVQQEITRATHPIAPASVQRPGRARNFAIMLAGLLCVVIVATAPLWAHAVFPAIGWPLVWPLAVGAASYVLVAVLCGSLYGVSQWRSLGLMIAVDGVLRLVFVVIGLLFIHDPVTLAWLVALPFPLTLMALWPVVRSGIVRRSELDVGYRALSWNAARTVLASASTAILVSGFPLLLGLTAHAEPAALVGELIFTITLTRAPLIVTVMSLQSYFVVHFRDQADKGRSLFLRVLGVIVAGGAVLGALGWWLGPVVLGWVSGAPFSLDGSLVAILVASSALVGALCVTGAAVLARSQHRIYSLGWLAAAAVTIVVMATPLDFLFRVGLTLLLGPVAGLLVHLGWLVTSRRGTAGAERG